MNKYLLLFTACCMMGCASTRITNSWRPENLSPVHYSKILVVDLYGDGDVVMRSKMEDHLVGDLKDLGYQAVSSLKQYGPRVWRVADEDTVLHALNETGYEAVLTIVLLDKEKERRYVPGDIYYSPYFIYQRNFWGYYRTMSGRIYSPGYYTTATRYFWESNLYDLKSKELLYSVQTESFDPASMEALAHEYGRLIVRDMVEKKVMTKQGATVANP